LRHGDKEDEEVEEEEEEVRAVTHRRRTEV